jgi:hypothetical protein
MKIEIFTKFTGIDRNGNIIAERKEERANSLVDGFIAWLQCQAGTTASTYGTVASIKKTNGNTATMQNEVGSMLWCAGGTVGGVGDSTTGIVVGTGTAAVTITDYNLNTKIENGTGAGQLSYEAEVRPAVGHTTSGGLSYFILRRTVLNGTESTITINEVGYIIWIWDSEKYLIDRTLPTPFPVPASTGAIIDYKWQISV